MFGPDWLEGCKICSMFADHYAPIIVHLQQRDVTMVTVSRAPLEQLEEFRNRMGWDIKWVSSYGNDFNWDYQVSFTPDQLAGGQMYYNDQLGAFSATEAPGVSVFYRDGGEIFHTYSSYSRGLDMFLGVYHLLDIVPAGRNEADFPYPMYWVRHRDSYDDETYVDPYLQPPQPDQE